MTTAFCTIITASYRHYAHALHDSIREFGSTPLCVLVVDQDKPAEGDTSSPDNIHWFYRDDVCTTETGQKILSTYFPAQPDQFRWCMKPVFIEHLLSAHRYEKVIFIDPDCFFFADHKPLFDMLDNAAVLLVPHWRSSNPYLDSGNFATNFTDGIFNGGLIGATKNGIPALQWWAMACGYKCIKDPCNGFFDDQRYLDLLHSRFEGVEAIRHKGCNVANWNMIECKRTLGPNDEVIIDGRWPIIFIHFTASTMRGILLGRDPLLLPHLQKYNDALRRHKPDIEDLSGMKLRYEEQQARQANQSKKNQSTFGQRILKKLSNILSP